ncbi:MAG: hypothetical protein EOS76_04660 [Mesorhizobium sp.]|uniref:hypothetical protein n=1 Tax=unclassified Mesorhizobium TaxID=325217 RepID=UPI000F75EEC8|nr:MULTISPECIES: hypothetical protein [unclassified Mesorhizobium]AZO34806.1 hypothetical protein EJ072_10360 [Mesorhizobium sp. M2A.F.Ca.ET.046.03.2.1]RVC82594.1 hypothetical protein EN766_00640 [Mesorhizobium sp. M2A.F.Ca.ET.046.02.1.1]RWE21433.1 MAG: hypothetical protein EOS76_04660 [Mesorhizobium sp.]
MDVRSALGSFHPGPGTLSFRSKTKGQYLNLHRMLQLYETGKSPHLFGAGLTSEDILTQTSVGHELRHFHDWLLSFSYLEAARRRLFLGVNAFETLRHFPRFPGGLFPLPLLDWAITDPNKRQVKIEELDDFFGAGKLKICDIPYFSLPRLQDLSSYSDSLTNGFLVCTRAALSIRMLLNGFLPPGHLSPSDVFELSAVATQLLTIIDRFGSRTGQDIYERNILNTPYDRVLDPIDALVMRGGEGDISGPAVLLLASAMALWAICSGPPSAGPMDPETCPSLRFAKLRAKLLDKKDDLEGRIHSSDGLIAYFDGLMCEKPIADRVALATAYFKTVTREMEAQACHFPSGHPMVMTLRYWQELLSIREELHDVVFKDLTMHMRGAYESKYAYKLTLPAIMIDGTEIELDDLFDDPLSESFFANVVGKERIVRLSDRMNLLEKEIGFVNIADMVISKIFFDQDFALSQASKARLSDAVESVVGHQCISL